MSAKRELYALSAADAGGSSATDVMFVCALLGIYIELIVFFVLMIAAMMLGSDANCPFCF